MLTELCYARKTVLFRSRQVSGEHHLLLGTSSPKTGFPYNVHFYFEGVV